MLVKLTAAYMCAVITARAHKDEEFNNFRVKKKEEFNCSIYKLAKWAVDTQLNRQWPYIKYFAVKLARSHSWWISEIFPSSYFLGALKKYTPHVAPSQTRLVYEKRIGQRWSLVLRMFYLYIIYTCIPFMYTINSNWDCWRGGDEEASETRWWRSRGASNGSRLRAGKPSPRRKTWRGYYTDSVYG